MAGSAFTDVIADQQFAATGLVLLANLARLKRLIEGIATKEFKVRARRARDGSRALGADEDLGESVTRFTPTDAALLTKLSPGSGSHAGEPNDYVSNLQRVGMGSSVPPRGRLPITDRPSLSPKLGKSRRDKSNAIDRLFSGLA